MNQAEKENSAKERERRNMSETNSNSSLLVNEVPLQLLPSLATKLGVSQALMLQELVTLSNERGQIQDGETWLRISNRELHDLLPFWNLSTVRDNIAKLNQHGYIKVSHFNQGEHPDFTNWYHVCYDQINQKLDEPEAQNDAWPEW